MAASYPQRGGGVSSKIVKLGDTYGDLPVPTRTGYSFVGWRGRNLFPIDGWRNSLYATFSQTSNSFEVSSISSASVDQKYICRDNFSLTKGTYYLSYGSYETMGEVDYPHISVKQYENTPGGYVGWSDVSITSHVSNARQNTYFYLPNDDDNLRLVIYVSINASTKTGTVKVTDLMLTKVLSENEIVKYEPYYIESDTIFGTPGDRTLTAEWGTSMGNIMNYSSWIYGTSAVASFSCSGDTLTVTSKNNISEQAFMRQKISIPAGTYKFCFDSCTYSGVKPYPVAIIYDNDGWVSIGGSYLRAYPDNYVNVGYFTFTSTHSCSFIVYACVDLGQSSCTVSFKNLRLIKLP